MTLNKWQHVAFVVTTANGIEIFIDGVAAGSTPCGGNCKPKNINRVNNYVGKD